MEGNMTIEHKPFRYRHDGWTPVRQAAFLTALRETRCVRDAGRDIGCSSTSAYRVRSRIPDFARAWDAALALALPRLERAAFERAVEGWEEPILYQGKVVAVSVVASAAKQTRATGARLWIASLRSQ